MSILTRRAKLPRPKIETLEMMPQMNRVCPKVLCSLKRNSICNKIIISKQRRLIINDNHYKNMKRQKFYRSSKPTILILFCLLMSFCNSSCIRKNYDDSTIENKENQNKFFELLRFCNPKGNLLWEENSQSLFVTRGFEDRSKDLMYFKIMKLNVIILFCIFVLGIKSDLIHYRI